MANENGSHAIVSVIDQKRKPGAGADVPRADGSKKGSYIPHFALC
jgi:hypothetical protein